VKNASAAARGGFADTYTHSLDSKRRLTIPAEWRAQVGTPQRLFVMPDFSERCLRVFPGSEMVRVVERLETLSRSDPVLRRHLRELGRQSQLLEWDTQGRIRIKDELLNFAGLKDQVQMVGSIDSFELWPPRALRDLAPVDQTRLQEAAYYFKL
jgi:MraZ protein